MNNLYITCKNIKQRQDVFDVLTWLGYSNFGSNGGILNIQTDSSAKDFSTWTLSEKLQGTTNLTYQEFMDKYSMNQLKTKIEEVKTKLGLTQMQLSERIGKNPYYLDTVKHRGVTTERQEELIRELDLVANGGTVMTERELIAELTEKAESLQEKLSKAQAANKELCQKLELSTVHFHQLEKMYDSNWDELQALKEENSAIKAVNSVAIKDRHELHLEVASLQEYKHQYRNLVATVLVVGIIIILGLAVWSVL